MITNESAQRFHVPVESRCLYRARPGCWSYNHHAALAYFRGCFYATWSNGRVNEDDCGQRVLMSTSPDGSVWTEPQPLFDSMPGRYAEEVLTSGGLYTDGRTLAAYAGCFGFEAGNIQNGQYRTIDAVHIGTRLLAKATRDGVHWEGPMDMHLPVVPNHGPQPLRSGRLLLAGGVAFPFTDAADGLSGWRLGGIYPPGWKEMYDDSAGIELAQKISRRDVFLCEGAFFQTDDDIVHMLLRSDKNCLWVTESRDDALTWSRPVPTAFSNCNTKFHAGRLPDGRFYVVGNPVPDSDRCPLCVTTSPDGVHFDREYVLAEIRTGQRVPGLHKRGIYTYPHSLVHDGRLYVICAHHKEDIYVYSVALRDLT